MQGEPGGDGKGIQSMRVVKRARGSAFRDFTVDRVRLILQLCHGPCPHSLSYAAQDCRAQNMQTARSKH